MIPASKPIDWPHLCRFTLQYNKDNARLFKRNPFILRGDEWKENRADISPAFTTTKVCAHGLVLLVIGTIHIEYNQIILFVDKAHVSGRRKNVPAASRFHQVECGECQSVDGHERCK